MTMLFEWLVSNAITASFLALVALAVGYVFPRRPALVHACWLLVLLKFLTPPIYVIPLGTTPEIASVIEQDAVQPNITMPATNSVDVPVSRTELEFDLDQLAFVLSPWNQLLTALVTDIPASVPEPMPFAPPVEIQSRPVSTQVAVTWSAWFISFWAAWSGTVLFVVQCVALTGTTYLLIVTLIRMIHFENLLQLARPAPATVHQMMNDLAVPLQLKHLPHVVISSGKVGPLLWQRLNTPIIVLPAGLVDALTPAELRTVLAHELTHYRRGDPFWRYLELVAVASYWWLPTSWLASARLRQAEEECCDAAVVAALPDGVASYAQALVRSLQFVTEPNGPCPALSSGLGPVTLLKRRLSMLPMNVERRLGLRGWLFLMAVATLALPFGVSLAQADDDDPPPPPRRPRSVPASPILPAERQPDSKPRASAEPSAPLPPAAPRATQPAGADPLGAPAFPSAAAMPAQPPISVQGYPLPGQPPTPVPGYSLYNEDSRSAAEFAVRQAELELKAKRVRLRQAERTIEVLKKENERIKAQYKSGTIQVSEVELSNARLAQAESEIEFAAIDIERAELNVEQAKRRMSSMRNVPGTPADAPYGGAGYRQGSSQPHPPLTGPGSMGLPGGLGGAAAGGGMPGGRGLVESSNPFFRNFDRRGTGKIERNDVPEWMRERFFEMLDANKDGSVDQNEFNERYSSFWGTPPGGGRGGMSAGGGRGGMAGGFGGGRGGAAAGSAPTRASDGRGERDPRDERIEQLEKELKELRDMLNHFKKQETPRK